ncbi:MAG: AAA family ATPase, partial [Clostridiales bacterium]|nr:AAA family ATPase [Clostridiales bacterium]
PGVGKTSLVHALARSINCGFKRIQFTPDIMPSDVTGFSIYNQKTGEFEFRPGSVMSNIILADEINRASAKTQASLLEAMEEKQVTIDSETYELKEPFMVMATQNPIESFGTYPLPEAQIDRFLIKISMGYPQFEEEVRVVVMDKRAKSLRAVTGGEDIVRMQEYTEQVFVDPMLAKYIVELVIATRNSPDLALGSSPRGGIALYRLSRAYALLQGRHYVIPDDIKYLVPFVLAHRVILTHDAKINRKQPAEIIRAVLNTVLVPVSLSGGKK